MWLINVIIGKYTPEHICDFKYIKHLGSFW